MEIWFPALTKGRRLRFYRPPGSFPSCRRHRRADALYRCQSGFASRPPRCELPCSWISALHVREWAAAFARQRFDQGHDRIVLLLANVSMKSAARLPKLGNLSCNFCVHASHRGHLYRQDRRVLMLAQIEECKCSVKLCTSRCSSRTRKWRSISTRTASAFRNLLITTGQRVGS